MDDVTDWLTAQETIDTLRLSGREALRSLRRAGRVTFEHVSRRHIVYERESVERLLTAGARAQTIPSGNAARIAEQTPEGESMLKVWLLPCPGKRGNGYWVVRWIDEAGKIRQRSTGVRDRRRAERIRLALIDELMGFGPDTDTATLADLMRLEAAYFTDHGRAPTTAAEAATALRHLAGAVRGGKSGRLASIDAAAVRRMMRRMTRNGLAPATINKTLRMLRVSWGRAVTAGLAAANPLDDVAMVTEAPSERAILTPGQVGRLIETCETAGHGWERPEEIALYVRLLWETAARPNEISHLLMANTDLDGRSLLIENCAGWRVKSRVNRRVAVTTAPTLARLRAWAFKRHGKRLFGVDGEAPGNHIRNMARQFARRVGRLPLPEGVTLYTLRRSRLSMLARHLTPAELQRVAGHASIQTTLRYYVRLDAEETAEAVRAVDAREAVG